MDSSQRALQTNGKIFSNFEFVFEFLAENHFFFFQKNSEAWILIKLQCVIYQWIRFNELNELYKQMESFFFYFEVVFEFWPITENFSIE